MNRKRLILWASITGIGVAVALTASAALMHIGEPEAVTVTPAPALPVATVRVSFQKGYGMTRGFSGLVQARRDSVLGFEYGGRLTRVFVDEGDVVKKGDVLAELDTDSLRSRLAELAAAEAEAKASLALAKATLRRMRDVVKAGGVSRQELDVAVKSESAAKAALDLARQRIATVDTDLSKSQLHAPFSGNIVERRADEGRVLGAGEPVVRLQSDSPPEIRIGIAGTLVDTLKTGQTYALEWQGRTLQARLRSVLPLRSASGRTVDALFDPLDHNISLRPGDLVTLQLTSHVTESGVWLPLTALAEGERGLWSVYVAIPAHDSDVPTGLHATHRLVRRTVDLIYQEGERVYVNGSLKTGDSVVATGLQRVVPEQWVRAMPVTVAQKETARD